MKTLAFIGAGSHSDAVLPMVDHFEYRFMGYYDDKDITEYNEFPILGKLSDVKPALDNGDIDYVFIAVGDNDVRRNVYDELGKEHHGKLINIVSKTATVLSQDSLAGTGIFIGHNAFVGAKVEIHDNCVINTGAVIEHHCKIGPHCNIAPNSTLNGIVTLGEEAYIGSGAIVIQSKTICAKAMVGAGAVVVKDIEESGTYVGAPARRIK